MDPLLTAGIVEALRLAIQTVVRLQEVSGKTELEIRVMFAEELKRLKENDPAKLPDV